MDPAFLALVQACAPGAAVETLAAVAQVESGLNPYAIRLNSLRPGSPGVARQPTSLAEATTKATALLAAGNDVDLGLMGLPSSASPGQGSAIEQAFDPCLALKTAASRLAAYERAAARRGMTGLRAEEEAIAAYFGDGDAEVGREAGYLSRILRTRASLKGRIASLTISPSDRPLPPRQGRVDEVTDQAGAAPRERQRPTVPRGVAARPNTRGAAEAPAWDVYGAAGQRGTTLLVFGRGPREQEHQP